MSVIFPTEPAKVKIHLVPKNTDAITYRVEDTLILSAWMSDHFQRVHQENVMTDDEFHECYCDGCFRNSYYFLEDYKNEDGDVDWDDPDLENHCNVYDDGYGGQYCPRGFNKEGHYVDFSVANMVFEISLTYLGKSPRFECVGDSAFLQKLMIEKDGTLKATPIQMASNVFGTEEYPEGICWGYNSKPINLRQMVSSYFSTPFNNDLLSLDAFEENCNDIRHNTYYDEENLNLNETYLCEKADALMILDAEEDIQAFYTMLMAGFKPLTKASHVMLIPLNETEFERNGKLYRGYQTIPDAVNKHWFISQGLLVGQI